jgi:hypothetical protein
MKGKIHSLYRDTLVDIKEYVKKAKYLALPLMLLMTLGLQGDAARYFNVYLDHARVVKKRVVPNSRNNIVYIKNFHQHPYYPELFKSKKQIYEKYLDVQVELLRTIDELKEENKLKIIGVECYDGEYKIERISVTKDGRFAFYAEPLIPQEDDDFLRILVESLYDSSVDCLLPEWIYADDIVTYGVQNIKASEAFDQSLRKTQYLVKIFLDGHLEIISQLKSGNPDKERVEYLFKKVRGIPQTLDELEKERDDLIKEMSYYAVDELVEEMHARGLAQNDATAALILGGGHADTVIEKLEQIDESKFGRVSYYIVEPNSYPAEGELPEFLKDED